MANELCTISSVSAVIARLKKRQKKLCNPVSVSSCIRRMWNFENILWKRICNFFLRLLFYLNSKTLNFNFFALIAIFSSFPLEILPLISNAVSMESKKSINQNVNRSSISTWFKIRSWRFMPSSNEQNLQ